MPKLSSLVALLMLAAIVLAGPARAEVELDLAVGPAVPSDSDYDPGAYAQLSAGYRLGQWIGRAGLVNLGEFDLDEDDTHASIGIRGPFVQGAWRLDTRWLDWELGLGVARLRTEAELHGRRVDRRDDWEPFVELGLSRELNSWLALKGGLNYFHDLNGSHITALSAGVRFSF